ncbi:MAG: permease [Verrucomicrobiota bacterium]
MNAPWFSFSLPDFSYSFLSVLLEGVPFILLGTLLSGLIDQFLPSKVMTRLLPRNAFLGIVLASLMGLVFPMCECGIVPVIRRLIAKGLPVANAVAYMLAAPIVNPIVAVSTWAAFRGQGAEEFTALRLGLGAFVAILAGLAVLNLPLRSVLKKSVLATLDHPPHDHTRSPARFGKRLVAAMDAGVRDFLDVMVYFILGVAVASLFGTAINQEIFLPLALNDWLAVPSMMTLAGILSLCSSSDAFIAATFVAFPAVAKLAFMVFGPMMDLKLVFIYSAVFTRRFVLGLAVGLFILIGLLCVRLSVIGL